MRSVRPGDPSAAPPQRALRSGRRSNWPAHALLSLLFALACAPATDPNLADREDGPVAGRGADGELVLRWSGMAPDARHAVYASSSPDAFDHSRPPVGELEGRSAGRGLRIPGIPPDIRHYFELVPYGGGPARIVAERRLPLDGAHNFRDLGGYRTSDGRHVRWGLLYRSDHLAELSARDLEYLERLGIRLVCDFRGASEREADPDRLPPGARAERLEIADATLDPEEIRRRILTGDLDDFDAADRLVEANRRFATHYRDRYRRLFERLYRGENLPILFHCTAGKDRTGLAAALILRVLGVPEKTIFEDFLRSNLYSARHIARTLRMLRFVSLLRTDPERVRPLLEVRRPYLEAAFAAIDEHYGSFDRYRREQLGVSDAWREALRTRLLR